MQSTGADSIEIVKIELFQAKEKYENFLISIQKNYPKYHSARFNLKISSAADIQLFLKQNQHDRAIINYHEFDGIFVSSVITADTILIKMSEREFDLYELSNNYRSLLTDPTTSNVDIRNLSELLIENIFKKDILNGISKITFILDPAMQHIPMELLQVDDQYLFENYDIGYHFSSTMLLSQENSEEVYDLFEGFAPSFDSLEFNNLQGALSEVRSIQGVYGGNTYLKDKALETSFRNSTGGIIHLATHAQIDEENPESSFLQFSKVNNTDDGRLHFFEIYNLDLNAQLVTLSACNTGFGKINKGEGVMSLSRAFAYAGVPATVVSLWPASDKSTPELMKHFYQNLKDGQAKDGALNNARKQYLATAKGKARHPFYWGGFVLIGDNSPIKQNRFPWVWTIPVLFVILLLFVLYWRKDQLLKAR